MSWFRAGWFGYIQMVWIYTKKHNQPFGFVLIKYKKKRTLWWYKFKKALKDTHKPYEPIYFLKEDEIHLPKLSN